MTVPPAAPTVSDPVDRLARGIAVEVRTFVREAGRRRVLPFSVHVGVPGTHPRALGLPEAADAVLRVDLVERALDGVAPRVAEQGRACAWTTRADDLYAETRDLEWLAASRAGFARHDLELPAFFVIGRYGWHELIGGRTRSWRRVRSRRERPARLTGPWTE